VKNVLILHGTDSTSQSNWFPWLAAELKARGWKVWSPDLPHAEKPNVTRYNEFLLSGGWEFNEDSVLIGHSSGAVEILALLPHLSVIKAAVLVGAFKDDLGWESLSELFLEPFDFDAIRSHAKKFVFVHSDDDPHCPLEGAQFLAEKVGGELIVKEGQKHFSIGTAGEAYKEFPFILEVIEQL